MIMKVITIDSAFENTTILKLLHIPCVYKKRLCMLYLTIPQAILWPQIEFLQKKEVKLLNWAFPVIFRRPCSVRRRQAVMFWLQNEIHT